MDADSADSDGKEGLVRRAVCGILSCLEAIKRGMGGLLESTVLALLTFIV